MYRLLSPYFIDTIMVQSTAQLATILDGNPLQGETHQNAVVINTCGEAVPIPSSYTVYNDDTYAEYFYELGKRVNLYNWTWASIVGYPFYYVSNTAAFQDQQNNWGIYGMRQTGGVGSIGLEIPAGSTHVVLLLLTIMVGFSDFAAPPTAFGS